ncbi:hypothetical protein P154DRAFT_599879 [Amniculicola lignicola CBS 123094]|uniref:Microbial-type PARG catalytic domain-containing protein n=1 Tax=Amniculicola lignicola CBS 123094 TaxID=1392246 RepID=A0A6A5WFZ2_9PLEO|nr:hypothetical protein P154DRAFT_599879 [Amniculicola lignicola CBS 123094]
MGRPSKSQGLAPPSVRKEVRAKQARHVVKSVIPAILASNPRARKGVEASVLIVDPGRVRRGDGGPDVETGTKREQDEGRTYGKRKGQGKRKIRDGVPETPTSPVTEEKSTTRGNAKAKTTPQHANIPEQDISKPSLASSSNPTTPLPITVRFVATDTLTAAQTLASPPPKSKQNVCILNMASPLRPGGGILSGATSQEEFLCARTTLLASLRDSFYRLPEVGAVFSPDVLVFRDARGLGDALGELGKEERFWVDVVSAGAVRLPDLGDGDAGEKRLGWKDNQMVERKMRAVLRIMVQKGVRRCVLGAWGCGAYGNPVGDVARAWRKVLLAEEKDGSGKGSRKGDGLETWDGLEEVVFAISNGKMAREFAGAWGGGVEVEMGEGKGGDGEEDDDGEDGVAVELKRKIAELEGQVAMVWNPELKIRLGVIADGLREQLREREGRNEIEGVVEEKEEEEEVEEKENAEDDNGLIRSDSDETEQVPHS